nr:hypothetical protein [Streptomyces sp. SID2888]
MILGFVRPKNRLRLRRTVADAGVLELGRLDETAPLIGMDAAELRSAAVVYENRDGMCLAGWPVAERVARHVAGRLADEILPEVDRKQQSIGQERAQSSWYSYSRRDDRKLDAEAAVLRTVRELTSWSPCAPRSFGSGNSSRRWSRPYATEVTASSPPPLSATLASKSGHGHQAAVPERPSRDGELGAVRRDVVGSAPDAGEECELPVI